MRFAPVVGSGITVVFPPWVLDEMLSLIEGFCLPLKAVRPFSLVPKLMWNKPARNFQARGGDDSHSGRDTEPAGCHKSWKRLCRNYFKLTMKTFQPLREKGNRFTGWELRLSLHSKFKCIGQQFHVLIRFEFKIWIDLTLKLIILQVSIE